MTAMRKQDKRRHKHSFQLNVLSAECVSATHLREQDGGTARCLQTSCLKLTVVKAGAWQLFDVGSLLRQLLQCSKAAVLRKTLKTLKRIPSHKTNGSLGEL